MAASDKHPARTAANELTFPDLIRRTDQSGRLYPVVNALSQKTVWLKTG